MTTTQCSTDELGRHIPQRTCRLIALPWRQANTIAFNLHTLCPLVSIDINRTKNQVGAGAGLFDIEITGELEAANSAWEIACTFEAVWDESRKDTLNRIQKHSAPRDGSTSIEFMGSELYSVETHESYESNQWTELTVYQTTTGSYVCTETGLTIWDDRRTHTAAECETIEEIFEFFGEGWLAEELYAKAGFSEPVCEVTS